MTLALPGLFSYLLSCVVCFVIVYFAGLLLRVPREDFQIMAFPKYLCLYLSRRTLFLQDCKADQSLRCPPESATDLSATK